MRWMAGRKSAWAVYAWLVAMGDGSADERERATPSKVEVLPPVLLRPAEPDPIPTPAIESGFAVERTRIVRTPYNPVGDAGPVVRTPISGISAFIQLASAPQPGA